MLTLYHTTNRNGPISLAYAADLGKYGYGNGIAVTERISGTVLILEPSETFKMFFSEILRTICIFGIIIAETFNIFLSL